ncbi:MAG: thioesterase superfamily protein [Thermoleophilia bacterium]|nr:thioesterase superfamily protein [Thermoleophilia bacterium]
MTNLPPSINDIATLREAPALADDPRPGTRPLRDSALAALGIELLRADAGRVVLRMPGAVARRTGAMLVLAESVASTASGVEVGPGRRAFGAELNAATLARPSGDGPVVAEGIAIRTDPSQQVWSVRAVDAADKLVLESRCTLSVVDAPST